MDKWSRVLANERAELWKDSEMEKNVKKMERWRDLKGKKKKDRLFKLFLK